MSLKVNIRPQDLKRFKKDVQVYIKAQDKAISEALDITAIEVQADAKEIITANGTTDRGRLRSSIFIKGLGSKSQRRKVFTDTGYAKYIEFGRPPGKMPPKFLIWQWAKKKAGLKGTKAEQENAVFLIRKKIASKGTKPQPFMRPAYMKNKNTFQKAFKARFKQI